MNTKKMKKKMSKQIRKVFHIFFDTIFFGPDKRYYLKHTNFYFHRNLYTGFERRYGKLPIIKNRIVVDNYMGKGYACNGKYVTEELLKTPEKYEIIWVAQNPETMKDQFPEGVKLVKYHSKEAYKAYTTAKVWLNNYHMVPYLENYVFKKPEQTYIQMWHGSLGIKKIENDSKVIQAKKNWLELAKINAKITDYWISNSDFEEDVFRSAFWGAGDILTYGHARNDIFFRDPKPYEEKVKAALGLVEDENFVLYVPTHRDGAMNKEMELLNFDMVREAFEERFGGKWKVVVRLHPRTKRGVLGEDAEGVISATQYPDIQELMVSAGALITDYSSCIFDYLLMKRPGFLFVTDRKEYTERRGLYYPLTDTPFPVAGNNVDMRENILHFNKEVFLQRADEFLKGKGCMDDGHASERIKALIDAVIEDRPIDQKNDKKMK